MPTGYNHNVCYGGRIYHAQTEACGDKQPVIATHLFLQGMVVASLRSSYEPLLGTPQFEDNLRRAMQAQHKLILSQLCHGKFETEVATLLGTLQPTQEISPAPMTTTPSPPAPPAAKAIRAALQPDVPLGPVAESEIDDAPISEIEQRMLARGQTISMALSAVPIAADGRIPFDHPAFEGFPMLELDLEGDEPLELDLDAVAQLERRRTDGDAGARGPTPELSLAPRASQAAASDNFDRGRTAPPAASQPAPPIAARPVARRKRPSLPAAPVAVELSEGIDTRRRGR